MKIRDLLNQIKMQALDSSIVEFEYISTEFGGFKNFTGKYKGNTIILERWSESTPVTINGKRYIVKDNRIRDFINSEVMYDDTTRRRWIEGTVSIGDGMLFLNKVPISNVNNIKINFGGKKKMSATVAVQSPRFIQVQRVANTILKTVRKCICTKTLQQG